MRFILIIFGLALSSCTTFPENESAQAPTSYAFSSENIMKVHQGMSSKEILKMFGQPKNVSQSVCGGSTKSAWSCTTWEYGQFGSDRASFTFSGNSPNSLILNNFSIDRD